MKTTAVTVSRTIRASADEVFDAWLDPTNPAGLWSASARVIMDAVVDGLFYILVNHDGRLWTHYGRFIRLERGRTIEHSWMSEPTQGLESIVTMTFEPQDGATAVTLHHANLPDDEMGRGHKDGWAGCLDKLAEQIETANPSGT